MSKYQKHKNNLIGIQMIVIYILVVVLAVMITTIGQRVKYEKQIAEINANHEEELIAL